MIGARCGRCPSMFARFPSFFVDFSLIFARFRPSLGAVDAHEVLDVSAAQRAGGARRREPDRQAAVVADAEVAAGKKRRVAGAGETLKAS